MGVILIDCLVSLFVCLFEVYRPTREFFIYMEMSLDIRLQWSSPRTRDTHTYYRTFSSGAVTTCFYNLCMSLLGFEHPTFRLRGRVLTQLECNKKNNEVFNIGPGSDQRLCTTCTYMLWKLMSITCTNVNGHRVYYFI